MRKLLIGVVLFCALVILEGVVAQNPSVKTTMERDNYAFNIIVNGTHVVVQNPTPKSIVLIYTVLGVKLKEYKVPQTGEDFVFELPKGCYIIKSENIVRKIAIK